MSSFIPYWKSYANEKEIADHGRICWSQASLDRGIATAALSGIASMLTSSQLNEDQLTQIFDQSWSFYDLEHRGIRISLFTISSRNSFLPSGMTRRIRDRSRESMCICILPSLHQRVLPVDSRQPQLCAGSVFALYPNDVDTLAKEQVNLFELLEYKLIRRIILEKPDPEIESDPQIIDGLRDLKNRACSTEPEPLAEYLDHLSEDYRTWIDHPLIPRVFKVLESGRGCLLVGPSASGKSVLASQVGRSLMLAGRDVYYMNFGNVIGIPFNLFSRFLSEDSSFILIADDLQSNPSVSRYVFAIASAAHRTRIETPPVVLGVSWVDFSNDAIQWYEDCLPLAIRSQQVRGHLVRQYRDTLSDQELAELTTLVGDDLFLLRLALDQSKRQGTRTNLSDVAEEVWRSKTFESGVSPEIAQRIGLVAGSLGRYDISVGFNFLKHEAHAKEDEISEMLRTRLLRRQGNNLTLGHRSLCGLISDWLEAKDCWKQLDKVGGPRNSANVVLDYLRSLGSSLAVDSLRALHARAGFKKRPKLNTRALAIMEIWQVFNSIVERIEHQQRNDPTWGKVPSSAMFAIQAFTEIGNPELAKESMEFLRRHWKVEHSNLNVYTDGLATRGDFEQIQKRMIEEDNAICNNTPVNWTPATEIDFDRFHQTWLLGLILCAEAFVPEPRIPLKDLAVLVESQQQKNGAFYPSRVPWCTARVLLGLSSCGRSVDSSEAVSLAIDWLLRDQADCGASNGGIWRSGTGRWNSDLESTSMVLLAVAATGYDCSDERLAPARAFLLSQRPQWVAPGNELAGAVAIQAFLDIGGEWEEVAQETQHLSQWARNKAFWMRATKSAQESLDQTCLVAQIASNLISIGWNAIRCDLPTFLDALETPNLFLPEISETEKTRVSTPSTKQVELSRIEGVDGALDVIQKMTRLSLSEYIVIGEYRRFHPVVRNHLRDWYRRIAEPLIKSTNSRENFLIWAAPGSGKSFFVQEIAASLASRVYYFEQNLALLSKNDFLKALDKIKLTKGPALCLLDEIDARSEEAWPYEECFPLLDMNLSTSKEVVFVLVGSSSTGLQGMVRDMTSRSKGKDLLDRIPVDRRFEIPTLDLEDRVIIFVSQILNTVAERDQIIREIEKLALYYVLKNLEIQTPRQLRELAVSAVGRLPADEYRIKYDDLFYSGDRRNQQFWVDYQEAASRLSNDFVFCGTIIQNFK